MSVSPEKPNEQAEEKPAKCACVFGHAITAEERTQVKKELDYAREIHDLRGMQIHLIRLVGYCPARSCAAGSSQ